MTRSSLFCCFASTFVLLALVGCGVDEGVRQAKINQAQSQVNRIAEDLDKQTTESGVYVRIKDNEIKEVDPWGTRIEVVYSQGGVAETLVVRSAGPDRQFHTADDIQAMGMTANLKGIGEGIKKNAEETAANAAKGAVKGTVAGVKESLKESFSRKKPHEDAPKTDAGQQPDPAAGDPGKDP